MLKKALAAIEQVIGENFFHNGFLTFQLSAWENYTT